MTAALIATGMLLLGSMILSAWHRRRPVHGFDPDWRVAPGETLREVLYLREITAATLASRSGVDGDVIRGILSGQEPITEDVARRIAPHTMVSSAFWLALEAEYRRPITPR